MNYRIESVQQMGDGDADIEVLFVYGDNQIGCVVVSVATFADADALDMAIREAMV